LAPCRSAIGISQRLQQFAVAVEAAVDAELVADRDDARQAHQVRPGAQRGAPRTLAAHLVPRQRLRRDRQHGDAVIGYEATVPRVLQLARAPGDITAQPLLPHDQALVGQFAQRPLHRAEAVGRRLHQALFGRQAVPRRPPAPPNAFDQRLRQALVLRQTAAI